MEQSPIIAFLEREASVYGDKAAKALLACWKDTGRLTDLQIYDVGRMRLAALYRDRARKARTADRVAERKASAERESAKAVLSSAASDAQAKLERASAARAKLAAKLGRRP